MYKTPYFSTADKDEVIAFMKENAFVYFTDINAEKGQQTEKHLGNNVTFIKHDVASEEDWKNVIGRIHQPAMKNNEDEDLTVILDPIKLPKGATIDKLKEVKREILSSVNTVDTETHNWLIENN